MRIPSVNYLMAHAKNSFLRFPLTILASFIAVVIGIYLIECHKGIANILPYINWINLYNIMILLLFYPLYLCTERIEPAIDVLISAVYLTDVRDDTFAFSR